jgi:hypothetical protein
MTLARTLRRPRATDPLAASQAAAQTPPQLPTMPSRGLSAPTRRRQTAQPGTPRSFTCQCGRPVFFRNSRCLACGTPLGYAPERMALLPLEPAEAAGHWRAYGSGANPGTTEYLRCGNLETAAACNWVIELPRTDAPAAKAPLQAAQPDAQVIAPTPEPASTPTLCRCCRLTRTFPDLTVPGNAESWLRIEVAKRRLVSSLIGFGLPVHDKVEDPAQGLAFDLLRAPPGGPKVTTGHDNGVITLDVEEADDATREQRRHHLGEVYRTLLGHLRHEIGHYYWQTLVEPGPWLAPFRALFGDERQDYAAALKAHYASPRADWPTTHVSAYASSHPWEDWAETWAHYLHMVDTMDTALSFGLDGEQVDLSYDRFTAASLGAPNSAEADDFLNFMNGWMELTGVLNELSRSMGLADFYPFVLPVTAVRKLYFVHQVVRGAAAAGQAARPPE